MHTPGPWKILEEMASPGYCLGVVPNDFEKGDEAVCLISLVVETGETDRANARLIAAAPDLLEALQNLVFLQSGQPASGIDAARWLGEAVEVLARAGGES